MIYINEAYTNLFKKTKSEYLYYISKGVYLGFDLNKTYIGIESFYSCNSNYYSKLADSKIEYLISKGILEIRG